jgi:hypothetical protein
MGIASLHPSYALQRFERLRRRQIVLGFLLQDAHKLAEYAPLFRPTCWEETSLGEDQPQRTGAMTI